MPLRGSAAGPASPIQQPHRPPAAGPARGGGPASGPRPPAGQIQGGGANSTTPAGLPAAQTPIQGKIVSDPTWGEDLRHRPALRALHRARPLLFMVFVGIVIWQLATDPAAGQAITAMFLPIAFLLFAVFGLPMLMAEKMGVGSVYKGAMHGATKAASAMARAGAKGMSGPGPQPGAAEPHGGPIHLPVVTFRLQDANGDNHDCILEMYVGPMLISHFDQIEATGKRRPDGLFSVTVLRIVSTGAIMKVSRVKGLYAEYAARVAWVFLPLWLLSLVVSGL